MSRNKAENCRNEVKSYITREGMTMTEVVELLADEHGWSSSVPNLSGKLRRGSLRYTEAVELADVLGYDLIGKRNIPENNCMCSTPDRKIDVEAARISSFVVEPAPF